MSKQTPANELQLQWCRQDLEEGGVSRASTLEFSAESHTSLLCNLLQLTHDYETCIIDLHVYTSVCLQISS